jgi:hypothetical protein
LSTATTARKCQMSIPVPTHLFFQGPRQLCAWPISQFSCTSECTWSAHLRGAVFCD